MASNFVPPQVFDSRSSVTLNPKLEILIKWPFQSTGLPWNRRFYSICSRFYLYGFKYTLYISDMLQSWNYKKVKHEGSWFLIVSIYNYQYSPKKARNITRVTLLLLKGNKTNEETNKKEIVLILNHISDNNPLQNIVTKSWSMVTKNQQNVGIQKVVDIGQSSILRDNN